MRTNIGRYNGENVDVFKQRMSYATHSKISQKTWEKSHDEIRVLMAFTIALWCRGTVNGKLKADMETL